ncbi:MAG: hypothetical protein ACREDR_33635, partial [Blastocatellia bacterium]
MSVRSARDAFVLTVGDYYKLSVEKLDSLVAPREETRRSAELLCLGYGVGGTLASARRKSLVSQIAFHATSCALSREEFCIMDVILTTRFPNLVAYLRKEEIGRPWLYVSAYSCADDPDISRAIQSIDLALRFSPGEEVPRLLEIMRVGAEAAAMTRFRFARSLAGQRSAYERLSMPSRQELDMPNLRSSLECPLCKEPKDEGLLACWTCYKKYGLQYGNPVIER